MESLTSYINKIVRVSLDEDLQNIGDITSEAIFSESERAKALIKSKDSGIISGCTLIEPLFHLLAKDMVIDVKCQDGDKVENGTPICVLEGPIRAILAGERTILNLLQRLSGIATMTSRYVKEIAHTNTKLLDTRKTTPGLRRLEKAAVAHGGGVNHRFGLFDMVLIKDTHVKHAGGVAQALQKVLPLRERDASIKIEVEVQSFLEFLEAIPFKPDRIMLDNMTTNEMAQCVAYKNQNSLICELEASGNITIATIRKVAETGVDFISSGSLTHSVQALDIHLVIL